jgi:hypothetical protein
MNNQIPSALLSMLVGVWTAVGLMACGALGAVIGKLIGAH